MRSAVIGLVIGVALLQNQAALPGPALLLCLLALAIFLFVAQRRVAHTPLRLSMLLASGAAIGFTWAALYAMHSLRQELPREWEGRDITLIGSVDSLPFRFPQGVRFNFSVEEVIAPRAAAVSIPDRIALSWYASYRGQAVSAPEIRPGERWRLTVRLRRPHGNANPYSFDYEAWLLEQNLRATGYVRPQPPDGLENRRLTDFVFSFRNVIERVRGQLRDRIAARLEGKHYAGVVVALVIGEQRAVSQADWKIFNRTGIGHLMSISGLHITMVAGLFAGLVFQLWRRSFFTFAALPLLLPAQKAAALAGALVAFIYVLLAGFGVPAQRTLYMLTVVAAALWFGRITSVSHVLCAALALVVVLDPWAVLWPGFWLSFGAVAIILYATVGRAAERSSEDNSLRQRLRAALGTASHTQYVVTLGLVPLTMLLFGQVSLVGPLANAIAIPLISFVVTPLSLGGSVLPDPLSRWALEAAHALIAWLAAALAWLSNLSWAVWKGPAPSWWIFLAAAVGALWLLAPPGWPARWLGALAWIPLLIEIPARPQPGQMWVTAFDVGQGTAVLIETHRHRLLYDTGPAYSVESDGGNRVVLPFLRGRGITRLDGLVVSHSDTDHAGGALSILGEMKVDWVSSSLSDGHSILGAAAEHRRCEAGQKWTWDEVTFHMLHPAPASYANQKWKPNARSCTLRVSSGGLSMLLPGDIEAAQEAELLSRDGAALAADVLLAPHHGSGTSSTTPFLKAVKPEVAIFQVGYRNRYRHPKEEIFMRYGDLGIRRLRTDESGAVMLRFGETVQIDEFRTSRARYWHGR